MDKSDVKLREKVIKYIGVSDVRVIYRDDWATIGVDHDDVVWDARNKWTVPAKDLSAEVLEYCEHDRELVITSQ